MRILDEFWYGNIEPMEYDTSSCKEYKALQGLICRNENKLLATRTDEQKSCLTIRRFRARVSDYVEYLVDLLIMGDSYERTEVIDMMMTDGRLKKLQTYLEKVNKEEKAFERREDFTR